MKKYSRKHIGKEFLTNEGYSAIVIDGGNTKGYCTINIRGYKYEVQVDKLKLGAIKYPYHKSVLGVGYIGDGNYITTSNKKQTKLYKTWKSMFERCYSKKYLALYPTYIGCTVAEEWHDFQNFADWYHDNYTNGWQLDKDILIAGNKIYSPETCCFIPARINYFMTNKKLSNTSGSIGVSTYKNTSKYIAKIRVDNKLKHLGIFNTKTEASNAYKEARAVEANKLRLEYRNVLSEAILNSIR